MESRTCPHIPLIPSLNMYVSGCFAVILRTLCVPAFPSLLVWRPSLHQKSLTTSTALPSREKPQPRSELLSALLKVQCTLIALSFLPFRCTRLATFPDYLFIQMKKFTHGDNWVPKKLGNSIFPQCLFLYLEHWTSASWFLIAPVLQMYL